jgi:hypothetical protein
MNRYFNKYWIKQKEYIRLMKKYNFLLKLNYTYKYNTYHNSEIILIQKKLKSKYTNLYYNPYKSKLEKKSKTKSNRLKNKKLLKKELNFINDIVYDTKKRSWY